MQRTAPASFGCMTHEVPIEVDQLAENRGSCDVGCGPAGISHACYFRCQGRGLGSKPPAPPTLTKNPLPQASECTHRGGTSMGCYSTLRLSGSEGGKGKEGGTDQRHRVQPDLAPENTRSCLSSPFLFSLLGFPVTRRRRQVGMVLRRPNFQPVAQPGFHRGKSQPLTRTELVEGQRRGLRAPAGAGLRSGRSLCCSELSLPLSLFLFASPPRRLLHFVCVKVSKVVEVCRLQKCLVGCPGGGVWPVVGNGEPSVIVRCSIGDPRFGRLQPLQAAPAIAQRLEPTTTTGHSASLPDCHSQSLRRRQPFPPRSCCTRPTGDLARGL